MAPREAVRDGGVEKVRARLLTALHVGELRPGDRVLSVRRLADLTGLNRKTVHRAYMSLAREGMLDVRPGSGTFVADRSLGDDAPFTADLLSAVNRCRAEAAGLGLSTVRFTEFIAATLGDRLRDMPVAVIECNREQSGTIAQDLRRTIGVAPREVLISELEASVEAVSGETLALVTTSCHLTQVTRLAEPVGLPVHSISLDPAFPKRLAQLATRAPVVMIVRDRGFAAPFVRLLRNMSVAPEIRRRFRVLEPDDALRQLRALGTPAHVYVSPLVSQDVPEIRSHRLHQIHGYWRVTWPAIERVRAELAFDLVTATAR